MIFNEDQESIRELAADFAKRRLTTDVLDEVERTAQFPEDIYQEMAELGFLGIKAPEEYGGTGLDHVCYAIVMEEIAKVSGVASIYISSSNSLASAPILMSGTEEQKKKYMPGLFSGEYKMCFALTEPGAGSDAGGMTTTAVKKGDEYILNGRKTFITGAPLSKYATVYAKTDKTKGTKGISAFIVDLESDGISFGKPEAKMGMIGCATSDIVFEDVKVPADCLLGEENMGFINAMQTLDVGRIGVASQSIGIAGGALQEAINFAKERVQFGVPIAKMQGIRFMIAEMATKLEASRLLTYEACQYKDLNDKRGSMAASMAKYYAAEACNQICADAVQIHGGYGFSKEYKVERMYRDARVLTIYEGTSQIQKVVIASHLL